MKTAPKFRPSKTPKVEAGPLAYSYIRFSTPDQLKGDSLRRQKEASEDYAKEHGLKLDRNLKLQDLGVSAFRGKNAKTGGALAAFLAAVEAGEVRPGSTLLVESLDRLSRDQLTNALTQFMGIINAGLTVVTLMDRMVYSRQTINENPGSLMMSIVVMMRAHEESAAKAHRLAKAWEGKRAKARETGKPLTSRCPGWLRLGKNGYEVITERALIVQRIFKLAGDGLGKRSIAKIFNTEGIPTWGDGVHHNRPSHGWHDSYILKITNSPAVLGTFQPGRIDPDSRKRVLFGDPIEGFYPRVISDEEWQRAHSRPSAPRGPRPIRISNLFSGLVVDGYTGERMHYSDKSSKNQTRNRGDQRYLYSDITRLKKDAKGQVWPYAHFENLILGHLKQVDWSLISDHPKNDSTAKLAAEIAQGEVNASKLQRQIDKFLEGFAETPKALQKAATAKASKLAEELEELQQQITALRDAQEADRVERNAVTGGVEEFRALIAAGDPQKRLTLQMEIRRRVRKITAFRHGGANVFKGTHAADIPWPMVEVEFINGVKQVIMTSIVRKPPSAASQPRGKGGKFVSKATSKI